MATVEEAPRRSPFPDNAGGYSTPDRSLPILPSTASHSLGPGDPMDTSESQGPTLMPPPSMQGSNERAADNNQAGPSDSQTVNGNNAPPVGAAAAAQQPKVVQTAFIHKLYNMLEDQSIQHLISWSNTNESFVMSPSSEFSKVLAQYFKHTNISSFVRQLNMYGFHKVSDVFHTGSPDSPLWEFKHGGGNFKRGDLAGLREIKRRASRHTLIHRDSFSTAAVPKPPPIPPPAGIPQQMEPPQDPNEARFAMLEWNFQDLHARLSRTEEAYTAIRSKCQTLLEGLTRCHQWNQQLSSQLLILVPDPENTVHRDVSAMRDDINRQIDHLRILDDHPDGLFGPAKTFNFQGHGVAMEPGISMSPRQRPADDSRRPSLAGPSAYRTPIPQHLQASPRRFGSFGSATVGHSPTASRQIIHPPPRPQQPPSQNIQQPHPLTNVSSPPSSLGRRHTSADIRLQGWQGGLPPHTNLAGSPYASGHSSTAWPSSPRAVGQGGDPQLQEALAQYELPKASNLGSRQITPPQSHSQDPSGPSFSSSFGGPVPSYANPNDAGWQLPGPRYPFAKGLETPGPPTRRSSMASNVHSLLNPADTAERENEDEGPDERKRKRLL